MLPFLQPKKIVSVMMSSSLKSDGKIEQDHEESENEGLLAAASDLLQAIHAKDAKAVAAALEAAFMICDSYEDEEEGEDKES